MVGPCPFAEPPGEVFRFLGGIEARDGNPRLVIAGRGLKGKECRLPYSAESRSIQIIQLHEMNLLTRRSDNDVVLSCCCARKQLRHGILYLSQWLAWPKPTLFAIDISEGQVKMRCANAGERIEHSQSFIYLLRQVSPLQNWPLLF